ncbi:response regulator transcription factor [Roseospira marina]|uniref:Regulatory protein VirG n=1 Tax=Roseospira marina TaxID=140057 RepID=A0A5M6I7L3_9PROT|nr:response regulator transcription factor [Roseospira marina]KAA5604206.1 response regulator transcription factor [Roseospira marina]MBB4315696.1 two-component system torCAD operon response regulator TorR [Roseospira marina]MBB5088808.1 two-component system torCAD operon response regulator TorR [Roseospira marina]
MPEPVGSTPQSGTVLVVDDDPITRDVLSAALEASGLHTLTASDGAEMARIIERAPVDVILLDIGMPGKDGFTITRELRDTSDVGLIIVTARDSREDRLAGLELGADDYVVKPVDEAELIIRVRNLLRRLDSAAGRRAGEEPRWRRFGSWDMDLHTRTLSRRDGTDIRLTAAEFDLLTAFVENAGEVMTRQQLLTGHRPVPFEPTERTVDVLVRRLRQKLEDDPSQPRLIVTVHRAGYIFTADVVTVGEP